MTVSTPNEVPCAGPIFEASKREIGDEHAMHVVLRFTSRACVCAYRTMDRLAMTIEAV